MITAQQDKVVAMLPPAAIVNNGAFTTTEVDTLGFNYLVVDVQLGALDIALTALNLQETDVSGSGYTIIPGCDYTVLPLTLPSATDDNHLFGFAVTLVGSRKRYVKLGISMGNGSAGGFAAATARLSRASIVPSTAATRGYTQQAVA